MRRARARAGTGSLKSVVPPKIVGKDVEQEKRPRLSGGNFGQEKSNSLARSRRRE